MTNALNKIVLFEVDLPLDLTYFNPKESGIWTWVLSPGVVVVTDDNGNTGYYSYTNATIYNIKSLRVDGINFSRMSSYDEMYRTDSSFYYDPETRRIYIHFAGWEPPLNQQIYAGAAIGFCTSDIGVNGIYFNGTEYQPRLKKVSPITKSKDPLFYGRIKTPDVIAELINTDGYFDSWRDLNLYNQAARLLSGDNDDEYSEFVQHYEGNISNDSTTWSKFTVNLIDPRGALRQPVARNMLNLDDWPFLDDNKIDTPKPVAYGVIQEQPAILLNGQQSGRTLNEYLICDTEFHSVISLDAVYNSDGLAISVVSEDLDAGTFTVLEADVDGDVLIDYTMPHSNGVAMIKDFMYNYDGKTYLSSFWDTTEVDLAESIARNTSIRVETKSTKLIDAIESICFDIGASFFNKNSGVYTIRLQDVTKTTVGRIYSYEWGSGEPKKLNNGNEYMTSCIVGYNHKLNSDEYEYYENTTYQEEAFASYKSYNSETFDTQLTDYAGAVEKSEEIMYFSKSVRDIVERSVRYSVAENYEIQDFVVCDPFARVDAEENLRVWEILGFRKDLQNPLEIELTLRDIRDYSEDDEPVYELRLLTTGEARELTTGEQRWTVN